MGFDVDIVKNGTVPPLLIAKRINQPGRTTVGIYGHYDVQSEQPIEEWEHDPYTLTLSNGKMYGRGVADNKGHIIQNLTAIKQLIESGESINIVCIFEGEEELGSEFFEELISKKIDAISDVDVFIVTDNEMYESGVPQIVYGLRGLVYFQLDVKAGTYDLHSGTYGNMAINPAQVISSVMAKMKSEADWKVNIPGFYQDVRKIPDDEIVNLENYIVTESELILETGLKKLLSQDSIHPSLVSKILPSMDINGIIAGFTGEGSKTIIPYRASVKFSFRLVPYQKVDLIEKLVRMYVEKLIPDEVDYTLSTLSKGNPFFIDINNPFMKKTAHIFSDFFGKKTVMSLSGGSIGAAEVLQRLFGKPVIVTGFVLPDCRMHGPNENYDEDMFWKGIYALIELYKAI